MQESIFEEIAKKIPANERLADIISDLLGINADSAYRRIRGEKQLKLPELVKIATHFNLSVDSFLGIKSNTVVFRYNPMDILNIDNYRNYIREIMEIISNMSKDGNGEMLYTAEDIPLFHFLRFRELTLFKIYIWYSAVSGKESTFEQFVKEIEGKDILYRDFDNLHKGYMNLPSYEIWTEQTVEHILKSLEYSCELGDIESEKTTDILYEQLKTLMENVEAWVKTEKKDDKGDFKLYLSSNNPENNFMLVKNANDAVVAIRLYTVKSIFTSNAMFCRETERWIKNIMDKSVLLSGASAKERAKFFQNQQGKIDVSRNRLKNR
ncbi:MAG: hypothetical protein LBE56_01580 [Tannerella sp.]|jgi:hypothetical protein|nr:hypothetical protein [Tannerella sp.]